MNGEYMEKRNVDECIICIYVSDWLFPSIFSTSLPVNSLLLSHSHLFPGGNSSLSVHIFQRRSTISYISAHIIFTHSVSFFSCIRRLKQMYCTIGIYNTQLYIIYLYFCYIAVLSIFSLLLLVCNFDAHPIQVSLLFLWRNIISFSACSIPLSPLLQLSGQLNFNYGHVIVLFILVTMTVWSFR